MKLLLPLILAVVAFGQSEVRMSQRNPDTAFQTVIGYSGTNPVYICKAQSLQPASAAISIASATNANPVVFTVTAGHGFSTSIKPIVTISGGTGSWAAVNGSSTATVINATTFSIAVDSTGFGAVTGTLTYTSRAPLLTSAIWSVQFLVYDGSNNVISTSWAGGTPSQTKTCSAAPAQYQ